MQYMQSVGVCIGQVNLLGTQNFGFGPEKVIERKRGCLGGSFGDFYPSEV